MGGGRLGFHLLNPTQHLAADSADGGTGWQDHLARSVALWYQFSVVYSTSEVCRDFSSTAALQLGALVRCQSVAIHTGEICELYLWVMFITLKRKESLIVIIYITL